jgi:glycosyltransferase involved in cell wall biosynthesis
LRPIVLIVPTRNEAAAIGGALAAVPRDIVDRIIVADGSSTDSTVAEARAAGAEVIEAGRGYGRACWLGALAAAENSILVFMDGDGSDDPACIKELVAPIAAGAQDFVIASRVRGEREPGSMGPHQILIGLVMGRLIQIRYGVRYTDMCAFRAIGRAQLLALDMREMTYGWNLEMQMRAAQRRLRILELPVRYRRRAGGESKVAGSFSGTIAASRNLLSTFFRIAARR